MARLKLLVQLALVTATVPVLLNPDSAQAAALGYTNNLGNASNLVTDFSTTVVDDDGTTATLTGRISAAQGNVLLTAGGNFSGVLLNLTNLRLTAPTTGSLNFTTAPLVTISNKFSFNFGTSVLAQQVLSGSYSTPSGAVSSSNLVTFVASTNGSTSSTTLNSGALSSTSTANFRTTAAAIVPNSLGNLNNPILSLKLPTLFLAANQTLNLPSSACYVVTNSPTGQTLLDQISGPTAGQDAEAACTRASIVQQSVPEPSAIAPLALFGMIGAAAVLKRKQQFQQG